MESWNDEKQIKELQSPNNLITYLPNRRFLHIFQINLF